MATINFTERDVVRLLDVPRPAVEELIRSKALPIVAYTRRGRPLFDAESVRRLAEHLAEEARKA